MKTSEQELEITLQRSRPNLFEVYKSFRFFLSFFVAVVVVAIAGTNRRSGIKWIFMQSFKDLDYTMSTKEPRF